ncbi:MAG: sialate O-acetylesterase [Planctomycetes bacterium]|nr:sialate O-acetylesterase [Planctomycetota bacterium]
MNHLVPALALLALALPAAAAEPARPLLATVFADHMVVQRDRPIPLWGWAAPGTAVAVAMAGNRASAVAGADGRWQAALPALPAGGPHTIAISGPENRTITDVLVGDVWICSGQSNMEWSVKACGERAQADIAASALPALRQLKVDKATAPAPRADLAGTWTVASPETVGGWTAVGYYFGRDLQRHLGVPIGLLNASWGGTRVEAWTSREVVARLADGQADITGLDDLVLNFDNLARRNAEMQVEWDAGKARLIALEKDEAHQRAMAAPGLDDSAWAEQKTPGDWDSQGHRGVKGEAWYRKAVEIPAAWAGRDLELSPGAADEIETTFFDGVKVGATGAVQPFDAAAWNVQRSYTVPGALVKPGRALIAVRVANLVGEGGLRANGDPAAMFLRPLGAPAAEAVSLAGSWRFSFCVRMIEPLSANPNTASVLFNAMISPLTGFPVKGAIWYQGESNAGRAWAYRERFPAMIRDWRARWGQGDLPFLWVQLANFQQPKEQPRPDDWAVLREAQEATLALRATGTALAIDVGDARDIHPKDKWTVGARLALAARSVAYGEQVVHSGPRFKAMSIEGPAIRLTFDHVGGGLVARDGELRRFAIAGADRRFVWAQARIDGAAVVVSAPEVAVPVAVRYAYEINPAGANLYNREGLPASPFRSDDWPVPTQPAAP